MLGFEFLLQTSLHSLVVIVTNSKTEGAGSIPDAIATVFALYADYQRTMKGSLQEPFKVLQEGFHLEPFLMGFT